MNEKCSLLLKEVMNKKYHIEYDKINYNKEEFYYEFKCEEKVSENDFEKLEQEIKKLDNVFVLLIRISGVYLDSNINKEMINRIVGRSFKNQEELNKYLEFIKNAKERDHRKIGAELDLFCFSDYVGAGLPLYTPRGTIILDELKKRWKDYVKSLDMKKLVVHHYLI